MDEQRSVCGFTDHCRERMAQRNVREDEVRYIVTRGIRSYRTGVICYSLPRRSVPHEDKSVRSSLESLVVLVHDGFVITVYRNNNPQRHIRRKAKYHDPSLRGRDHRGIPRRFAEQSFAASAGAD